MQETSAFGALKQHGLGVLTALVVAATVMTASAQPRDAMADAQTIFTSVMSPYCPGRLLADCPSPAAFELRGDIIRRLESGESAADIERDLYRTFGDSIRAVPPARGWGRVLSVAPAIALTLSFAALVWFLARHRAEVVPEDVAADPALEERLQDELDQAS